MKVWNKGGRGEIEGRKQGTTERKEEKKEEKKEGKKEERKEGKKEICFHVCKQINKKVIETVCCVINVTKLWHETKLSAQLHEWEIRLLARVTHTFYLHHVND